MEVMKQSTSKSYTQMTNQILRNRFAKKLWYCLEARCVVVGGGWVGEEELALPSSVSAKDNLIKCNTRLRSPTLNFETFSSSFSVKSNTRNITNYIELIN